MVLSFSMYYTFLAATDKVAILLGNANYVHLKKLESCVANVHLLKEAFTEAGFKVSISYIWRTE